MRSRASATLKNKAVRKPDSDRRNTELCDMRVASTAAPAPTTRTRTAADALDERSASKTLQASQTSRANCGQHVHSKAA